MQKKKLNRLSITKLVLAIMIILLVSLQWHNFNIFWPSYMFGGKVIIVLNYVIAAFLLGLYLFISLINKRYDLVNEISSKLLIDCLLITFAYNHNITLIVPLIVIAKDVIYLYGDDYKEGMVDKVIAVLMYIGFLLVLLGNIPFEFLNLAIDQGLILIATCLSVYACLSYLFVNKKGQE